MPTRKRSVVKGFKGCLFVTKRLKRRLRLTALPVRECFLPRSQSRKGRNSDAEYDGARSATVNEVGFSKFYLAKLMPRRRMAWIILLLEFALLTRPMGVAVPFEGHERHPSRDEHACFCGSLAVDQAAIAVGDGPAAGMRPDFRLFRANSPSTRQFQKRRIRPSLIMPGVG